ncbi:hypothetical protein IX83_02430 [Basilea psittacipulmonis DSM 24701]|uniref:Cell division protein FtsZ n=1 Tax=Basilea psittacipulmonis DSM 24701 TaxID=1072685 RepID=A0A077DBV6_9BURK|nr:hypothetical protein IX83_02430 [Basilea psittacipulmonis DSM 24701]
MTDFELVEEDDQIVNIKVIGVGGAGGNAVRHMIDKGLTGVEFICINTDQQALSRTKANKTIGIGLKGRGAGGNPETGRSAVENKAEDIKEVLKDADMVFIAAGMGGGTGTGAAPYIAQLAKEQGILTVAIVTKPFEYEGNRVAIAEKGIQELRKHVDAVIVVLNEKFLEVMGDDASLTACLAAADDVLYNACTGIVRIITEPGVINTDFEDVYSVLHESGQAIFGVAEASGPNRAKEVLDKAISCPLVEGNSIEGASGILVYVESSNDLKASEYSFINKSVYQFTKGSSAKVFIGNSINESLKDTIRLTVVATGLEQDKATLKLVEEEQTLRTGTDDAIVFHTAETPRVISFGRGEMRESGSASTADLSVPAFLRRNAD